MSELSTFLKAHASVVNILGQIATIALDAAPIPALEKNLAQTAVNDAVNSANNNGANAEQLEAQILAGGAAVAQQVVPPATTQKIGGLAGDLSEALSFIEGVFNGGASTATEAPSEPGLATVQPTETVAGPVPQPGSSNIAAAGDPNA